MDAATSSASDATGSLYPTFVHSLPGGELVVTDDRTHTLHVLTLQGEFRRTITGDGDGIGFAMGVASHGDVLFVADGLTDVVHRLQLSTGRILASAGGLSCPHSLAVAGDTLFCADWGNHRVQCFDARSLQPLMSIGGFGEGDGALCYPRGLATAGSELFVADTENHRVQVFTLGGRHVRSIGPIRQPYAVAVAHGRLFVAQMDGRLKILSLEPQAVLQEAELPGSGHAGGGGAASGPHLLCGLCVDARRVYVAGYVADERKLHVLVARPPADDATGGQQQQQQSALRPPTAGPRAGRRAGRPVADGASPM